MSPTASQPKAVRNDRSLEAPKVSGDFKNDSAAFSAFWFDGLAALDALPTRAKRSDAQQAGAADILATARASRQTYLAAHAPRLYRDLTQDFTVFRRIDELANLAAAKVPGLVPTPERVAQELTLMQSGKDGHEIDQGLLLNYVLGDEQCGRHLCHAMLLPKPDSIGKLDQLKRDGRIDLGKAVIERQGKASIVYMKNSRYLNAEDNSTSASVETAVDLALLDPETSVCVLRGHEIEEGKYKGQRVFSTGINLTHLYNGRIPYLWYLSRDFGFVNKIYRGLARPDKSPDEIYGETLEKPWIAVVEKFAIGGGCQYLLTMDYTIAGSDAYMTLPARKEGIIPGVANLRLPRFVGDRIARQAIMSERRIDCDSPEGLLICDLVVPPDQIEAALDKVIDSLTNSGVVSAASNRKSFRVGQETIDQFRMYMAQYSREQAYCHFSPALIANLEKFWNAQERTM